MWYTIILLGIERKLIWVNADIAVARPTGQVVSIRPRANIATVPAQTSAYGAAPPPTAPAASIARLASMRSKETVGCDFFNNLIVVHRIVVEMLFVKC